MNENSKNKGKFSISETIKSTKNPKSVLRLQCLINYGLSKPKAIENISIEFFIA